MHRLFVALRPPPAIRAALGAAMDGVADARWQDDDQLHLTLRFIGAVERPLAEDIAAALATVAAPAVTATLAGVGTFAKAGRVTTLWAGLAPREPLAALHRKVDRALVGLGLGADPRAFLPHVTLARLARSAGDPLAIGRWRLAHAALASAPFVMPHLILYESHLGRQAAEYEPIARWPLLSAGLS